VRHRSSRDRLLDPQGKGGGDLQCVNFQRANLQGVYFWNARLKGADLSDALLNEADFLDAQGLTTAQVLSAAEKGKGAWLPIEWLPTERDAVWEVWDALPGSSPVRKLQWEKYIASPARHGHR
jgi:hypothetical protein